jgi:hypothetical protein
VPSVGEREGISGQRGREKGQGCLNGQKAGHTYRKWVSVRARVPREGLKNVGQRNGHEGAQECQGRLLRAEQGKLDAQGEMQAALSSVTSLRRDVQSTQEALLRAEQHYLEEARVRRLVIPSPPLFAWTLMCWMIMHL